MVLGGEERVDRERKRETERGGGGIEGEERERKSGERDLERELIERVKERKRVNDRKN